MIVDINDDPQLHRYIHDRNLLRQYDALEDFVDIAIKTSNPFPSHDLLHSLNHFAVISLSLHAGKYRPHDVVINNSNHKPGPYMEVPKQMQEFLTSLIKWWDTHDPTWLASYCLWNINWVHPFAEGNGRTARAVCYYVLCVKLGMWLPGSEIIPQQIRNNRGPYYKALRAADAEYSNGDEMKLSEMRHYLEGLMKIQLATP